MTVRSRARDSAAPGSATAPLRIINAADTLGIRGMVVLAIPEQAKAFYLAPAFDLSRADPMTLMVTLAGIRKVLE